eukprot:SAG11_NODE_1846_length_4172_cov_3.188313_10_plen_58_part_01
MVPSTIYHSSGEKKHRYLLESWGGLFCCDLLRVNGLQAPQIRLLRLRRHAITWPIAEQ